MDAHSNWQHTFEQANTSTSSPPAIVEPQDPLRLETGVAKENVDESRPRSTVLFALPNAVASDEEDFAPASPQEKGDTSIFAALQLPLETLTSPEMVVIHYGHSILLSEKQALLPEVLASRGLTQDALHDTLAKVHKIKSTNSRRRSLSCAGLGFLLSQTQISAHDKRVSDQVNSALERTNRQLAAARVGVRFAWISNQLRAYWDEK